MQPLAKALGLTVEADTKANTVSISGKKFEAVSNNQVKGIHVHDGAVFVPLKEFAAATGLKADINFDKGTAVFAK